MQLRCSTWSSVVRGLAVLAILAPSGLGGFADPPKPLSKEIVDAWKKAAAEVGWMWLHKDTFDYFRLVWENEGVAADVPAFKFRDRKVVSLQSCPTRRRRSGWTSPPPG